MIAVRENTGRLAGALAAFSGAAVPAYAFTVLPVVPEPGSLFLVAGGLAGAIWLLRKQRRR